MVVKKVTPKVVVIGGGTGTFTVLSGLRDYPVSLSAVISMADSGGSNRILRDEFGILPTSDIRQALVALADDKGDREIFRKLFTYRFHQGIGISGMTFGNLFMAALTDILGSQQKAIEETAKILHIKGQIFPVTLEDVQLLARYENGHQVVGEHYIDEPRHNGKLKIVELETIPKAKAYPLAVKAIKEANLVVLGPGDLYTSLVCTLPIDGIAQALRKTKGQVVYIVNLMGKYGQSYRFSAKDHLEVIEKYLGRGVVDTVLINNNLNFPKGILKKYEEEQAFLVENDLLGKDNLKVVEVDLLSSVIFEKPKADHLHRSMIRHDPQKLAQALLKLI
jgi:uncharacterized cofD-like protein